MIFSRQVRVSAFCWIIGALLSVLGPGLNHSLCAVAAEPVRPNVIFILCDDLGWGDLGVLHQNTSTHPKQHRTPMLDEMAAQGAQLRRHYCPAPVCAPSRASLLTGVHQGNAVIRDNQFDKMLEDNHTIATVMKSAGYTTALIGKYGLQGGGDSADTWPGYPTRRGFDEFYGYVRHVDGHVHYPTDRWPAGNSDKHQSPKEVWHNDREVSAGLTKCYTTDLFTARSKQYVTDHVKTNAKQPFFLYLAYDTPHAALQVPTVEYPAGQGVDGGVQWLGKDGQMINTAVGEIDTYRHPDYVGQGWSDVEERFATMVRRIDNAVGDLLQTLRDLDIDENTLVIISSDNGPHKESYIAGANYNPTSFQSYGSFDGIKRDVWEGGIRVPTLAWWPGHIQAGTVDDRASQFHDWLPTFADLAGVAAPARTDGVSLAPRLAGQPDAPESQIYVEYSQQGSTPKYDDFDPKHRGAKRGQQQVIHLDGFKGIRMNIKSHDEPFQIYDLSNDPGETKNLATSSDRFVALQRRMQDRVLQIRRPNDSAKRPYDGEPIPALIGQSASSDGDGPTMPGVRHKFFPGTFSYVPKTQTMTAASGGAIDRWDLDQVIAPADGAVEISGYLSVAESGDYKVQMSSGQQAFLRIHDAAVIDADFGYSAGQIRTATIKLAAGLHPFTLTCRCQAGKSPDVSLSVEGGKKPNIEFRR